MLQIIAEVKKYGTHDKTPVSRGEMLRRTMGMCLEGKGSMSVEVRRESIVIHAGYGYTAEDEYTPDSDHFGRHWRETPHPEFLKADLDDLIAALVEARDYIRSHS